MRPGHQTDQQLHILRLKSKLHFLSDWLLPPKQRVRAEPHLGQKLRSFHFFEHKMFVRLEGYVMIGQLRQMRTKFPKVFNLQSN